MLTKQLLKTAAASLIAIAVMLTSCKDDSAPTPAPQVSGDKSSLNLISGASDEVALTIVSPGKFSTVTATADNGTVSVDNVTGTGTKEGSAKLTYTAPDEVGNYKITVSVMDAAKQTGSLEITVAVTAIPPVNVSGEVEGTWAKNTTYIADGTLTVAKGKSLTIPEGVTVIFDGTGTQAAPEFAILGNLYCMGTADKPITFTIPEAKRTKANIFAGLWGGIQATPDAGEVVLQYAVIEYTGAPTGVGNASLYSGSPYADGDPRYGLLFSNTNGKFVMQHSIIRYTADDGMRVVGGTVLITNNTYILTGKNGGESVNIKSSVTGTVAYNMSYRSATNAYKWSNASGTSSSPQTDIDAYNNTAVECGWRQTKTGRGGSVNIEKGGRGQCYNNLIVNCRFGVKLVKDADTVNINTGYNHYYGTDDVMVNQFYPTDGWLVKGWKESKKDIAGLAKENDPAFASYTVSDYTSTYPVDPSSLDYMSPTSSFFLKTGAPGLAKGKTGFTVKSSFIVNGVTYTPPAPSAFIGAYGTN
jgi:hypothetical protein